jgi:hypothetical protein
MNITNLILSNDVHTGKRILILLTIAWLPLVVLTAIDGSLFATDITMPFIKDAVPYVRGLIVIPLFVMADNIIEPMMSSVVKYLKTSGIVPESEQARLHNNADRMARLINAN